MQVEKLPQGVRPGPRQGMQVEKLPQGVCPNLPQGIQVEKLPQGVCPDLPQGMQVERLPQGVRPDLRQGTVSEQDPDLIGDIDPLNTLSLHTLFHSSSVPSFEEKSAPIFTICFPEER